jgi:hypothetical protein
MAHVRQQLIDAVVTRVTGLTTTAARVFAERPEAYALQDADLPCLLVYDDGEPQVTELALATRIVDRTIALRVEVVAKAVSGLAATLRTACSEVETALGSAVTVGSIPVDVLYRRTESIAPDAETDRPVGRLVLFFEAQLATAAAAPDVLLSY